MAKARCKALAEQSKHRWRFLLNDCADAIEAAPCFKVGFINRTHDAPHRARSLGTLASAFVRNAFFIRPDLGEAELENFVVSEERTGTGNR